MRAVADQAELVATRLGADDRRGQAQRGVLGGVDRELQQRGLGLVEQLADVGACQARGHQAEGSERRVPSADVRVGGEDAVSGIPSRRLQRGSGVGDDDDALSRVDAEVTEGGLEGAPLRVGLDGGSRLRRDDQRRPGQTLVDRAQHLSGGGAVEDGQRHAGGVRDDLRGERGAAHAGQHDPVDPARAEVVAQGDDLRDERAGVRHGVDPAETHGCLGGGIRTPQVTVGCGDT